MAQASTFNPIAQAPVLAPSWQEREELRSRLLSNLDNTTLAALGAKYFDVFSSTVMPESFYLPSSIFHQHLTDIVSVNQMTGRREATVGPRGWGKSTTITEGGSLWITARNLFIPRPQRYRFILIVSDTSTQAEARLAVIKSNLESNEKIEQLYPDVYGKGPVWRSEMIVTRNDICVSTAGMNSSIRGTKYKNRRPDLIICHERGTQMRYGGEWIPVEAHPSFTGYRVCDGLKIFVHGLPEPEIVTPEHRYWAREVIPAKNGQSAPVIKEAGWVEASALTTAHYIGEKIDHTQLVEFPKVKTYCAGNSSQDVQGRLTDGGGTWKMKHATFFNNPLMWFVIGPRKEKFPNGRVCWSQQKYDIRFRNGIRTLFGYDVDDQTRYRTQKQFIADGFMWRAVKEITPVTDREFCPIKTEAHTYSTAFGLSHNCDDPDDLESARSPTTSRDREETFTRDLLKCGHANTDILVVGTIISKLCLAHKLLFHDDFSVWNGTLFKALAEFPKRMDLWNRWGEMVKDRTLPNRAAKAMVYYRQNQTEMDEGGVSNWPEVYPVRTLMYEYYTEGRKAFLTEKQNQCIEADSAHFTVEKYRHISEAEFQHYMRMNPVSYLYVDPSGGASASSKKLLNMRGPDKFAATIIAKLDSNLYMLVDQVAKQCRQSTQFEEIAKMLAKWRIFRMTVEANAGQVHYVEGLRQFLTAKYADKDWAEKAATQNLVLPRAITNSVSKEERISMLEPYLDNFTLLLREDMPKTFRGLNDELEDWPNSEFDDCLDSLSGCFFSAYKTFKLNYLYLGGGR